MSERDYVDFIKTPLADLEQKLAAANARIARLEEALTPSLETRAEYSGEVGFYFGGGDFKAAVPWTIIKEIMAMILARANRRARAALAASEKEPGHEAE